MGEHPKRGAVLSGGGNLGLTLKLRNQEESTQPRTMAPGSGGHGSSRSPREKGGAG